MEIPNPTLMPTDSKVLKKTTNIQKHLLWGILINASEPKRFEDEIQFSFSLKSIPMQWKNRATTLLIH